MTYIRYAHRLSDQQSSLFSLNGAWRWTCAMYNVIKAVVVHISGPVQAHCLSTWRFLFGLNFLVSLAFYVHWTQKLELGTHCILQWTHKTSLTASLTETWHLKDPMPQKCKTHARNHKLEVQPSLWSANFWTLKPLSFMHENIKLRTKP